MPVYHKVGMFVFISDIVLLCVCYTDSELEDLKILQKFACKIWADRCYHLWGWNKIQQRAEKNVAKSQDYLGKKIPSFHICC